MKTKNLFLVPALIAVLNLLPAGRVTAQTFTTLHSFTASSCYNCPNSDGAFPYAGLIANSSVNTDGTGFTNVHNFTALVGPYPGTNSDGANPQAGLILSGNTLYGTAGDGGNSNYGTVFTVNTDGTGFTNLHSFTGSDGAGPQAELITSSSGNTLYGTAWGGGSSGAGTVFAVNSDGTGFTNLHSFTEIT